REVILRKRCLDGARLAGPDPAELVLETGNERVRADLDPDVFSDPALERLAVDGAGERYRHLVALFRRGVRRLGQERTVLCGDLVDRRGHLLVANLGYELFELDALHVRKLDPGQDLHRDRIGEIDLAIENLL